MPRYRTTLSALFLAAFCGGSSFAQVIEVPLPARVIGSGLESHSARPFVIDDVRVIAWPSPHGVPKAFARANVLAIVVGPADSRATDSRWRDVERRSGERSPSKRPELRLNNGHVLPGSLLQEGETIFWRYPRLGTFPTDLEKIDSMRLIEGAEIPKPGALDVVLLANGDSIEGLVLELADPLPIERTVGETASIIEIPLERVAAFALVNPPAHPSGIHVWTSDGAIFSVEEIRVGDDGYVRLIRPSPSAHREVEFQVEALRGVLFEPQSLIPLAELEAQVDTGQAKGIRPWAPPPKIAPGFWPLGAASVQLNGPIRARWKLPAAGCTFAARAELPIDSIQGDFDLVVRDGGEEVFRQHFDRNEPIHRILVELNSRDLEIELEMGGGGPVQDDLLLHDAVLRLPKVGES